MAIVHTTTPETITENEAIRKRSPEWSDLKNDAFRKRCILTTLTRDIQREKFIEDESVSHELCDSMHVS